MDSDGESTEVTGELRSSKLTSEKERQMILWQSLAQLAMEAVILSMIFIPAKAGKVSDMKVCQ